MNYGLFIDESGHAQPLNVDPNCPKLTVCGVIFDRRGYKEFKDRVDALKTSIFGTTEIVFHSRDIRKKQGPFKALVDPEKERLFVEGVNLIMEACAFRVVSAVIDKLMFNKEYPFSRFDVYKIALEFIMERSMYHIDPGYEGIHKVKIIAESRGANEDGPLRDAYEHILSTGNQFNEGKRFKQVFTELEFKRKKDRIDGLELADLCAYPIGRHVADSEKSHPSYRFVEKKMLRKKGTVIGAGLKLFPVQRS